MQNPETEYLMNMLDITEDDIYIDTSGSVMKHNNIKAGFSTRHYCHNKGDINDLDTISRKIYE